ncbi:ribonuclease P protein component [Nocardioides sp. GY 10113]|uniref:ribonuclease P protein component n=1 Tax=Nocardioides sp. GY 10113 TaxID=2569761 RepID=UPI0010A8E194|nr:ribonuclease P protein component [Nocardioides sp. GY 10113]TIC88993.1 ribonuclease P protein component [Nocardioides sp. GY 10113]
MLPTASRLRDSDSFRVASREGRRSGSRTLVTHLLVASDGEASVLSGGTSVPRVGFVVSKAVGGAVVRTRVKRRLRHAVAAQLAALPPASVLVVRATPAAASASFAELDRDLRHCLARVCS